MGSSQNNSSRQVRNEEESETVSKRAKLFHPVEVPNPESLIKAKQELDRQCIDLVAEKHGPLFLALPKEEQAWLLKVHSNMGHPGVQKLKTFCNQLGCPENVIKATDDLKCSTCTETKQPTIPRPSAIHEDHDFGDILSMDGVVFTNQQGKQFHFYHFVDQSTCFQTAVSSASRTPEAAIRALMDGWIKWAGTPGMLCLDSATEFGAETFNQFVQRHNIKLRMIPPECHWQNSRCERHGGILQNFLQKMDVEDPIDSYEKLETCLSLATQTKNQWSRHRGYPPEMLVFGRMRKVPGSIGSDEETSAHLLALSERPEGIRFREELARRESARKAFSEIDNNQALRRAIHQRNRPSRGHYYPNDWVMVWKKEGNWVGPMKVIIQENTHVLWVTMGNKLFRTAPEMVRPLSALEDLKLPKMEVETDVQKIVVGTTRFEDLLPVPSFEYSPSIAPRNEAESNRETPDRQFSHESIDQPESEVVPQGEHTPTENSEDTEIVPPEDVPVPVDDDDELYCRAFHVQEDQVWRFEVEVSVPEARQMAERELDEQVAFIVSNAKKQRAEVKLSSLTWKEKQEFDAAKQKEIQSWLDTKTVAAILRNKIPQENIMRCRWILSWKNPETNSHVSSDNQNAQIPRKAKARIVVLGYEDPMLHEIERDSPTLTKLSRTLILQFAASQNLDIGSCDIKAAFLRGSADDQRILAIEPLKEMRESMNLKDGEICQLLKGAYGRVDAPLLWHKELTKGLLELGFIQSPFDPCLYMMINEVGNTIGMIGFHVDDGLFCGNKRFLEKIDALERKFPFGRKKTRDFVFTGLHVQQRADYSIRVEQSQYVKDIAPITMNPSRRKEVEHEVTEDERHALRAIIGSLQYAAINTRPDICSRLGALQSRINKAQVIDLIEANKTLHEAKVNADVGVMIQPIKLENIRFVAFSDASFASEKNLSSHQGMIIVAADKRIIENEMSWISPIAWSSKKIQKVAVSTLSAEAMALAGSMDSLAWIRLFWAWIVDTKLPWRTGDKALRSLPNAFATLKDEELMEDPSESLAGKLELLKEHPIDKSMIATDCKSLYDLINRNASPSCAEFRTLLQAKLIKEHLATGVFIRWVPSGAQMADALTKIMDSTVLREFLRVGRYKLFDENEILKSRADARTRVKWLQENTSGKAKSS